jgi:RNA polymerase sigma-70 factor (sigma-E family)
MVDREDWAAFGSPSSPRDAVSELFHLHYRRLVGLAGLMVDSREAAEEVVQDSFESLYRNWSRLRDPQAAVGYLNRSVVNRSRSQLRHRRTVRAIALPEADVVPSAEARGVDLSRQRDLAAAVRQLPRRQREVMVLRYFLDLSEIEIASWLGVSPGSVKRHASRAIESLRKRMEAWA